MIPKREIQIFNFAFLDILTSTLGALLFIFLLALINQMGLVAADKIIKQIEKAEADLTNATVAAHAAFGNCTNLQATIVGLEKNSSGVTQQVVRVAATNQWLIGQITEIKDQTRSASNQVIILQQAISELQKQTPTSGKSMLPTVIGKTDAIPCHVECNKTGLIILGEDVTRQATKRETCPLKQIETPGSTYRRLLARLHSAPNRRLVLVLWVRPDGVAALEKALPLAKEAGVPVGYEPAETDWVF
jgi:hypothetical protein